MHEEIYEIDIELSRIRRQISKAEKWGLSRNEIEILKKESFRLLARANKANYSALGLRAVKNFAMNPYAHNASERVVQNNDATRRRSSTLDVNSNRAPGEGAFGSAEAESFGGRTTRYERNNPRNEQTGPRSVSKVEEAASTSKGINQASNRVLPSPSTASAKSAALEAGPESAVPKPSDISKLVRGQSPRVDAPVGGHFVSRGRGSTARNEVTWAGDSYRTFLAAGRGVDFGEVLHEIQDWINVKNLGVSVRQDEKSESDDGRFVAETQRAGADREIFKLHLIESPNPADPETPTYSTSIVAHGGTLPWVWIDIRNDKRSYVNVPRIARSLMRRFPFFDAQWRMRAEPAILGVADVDGLIASLKDEGRRVPLMLVGSTGDSEFQQLFEAGLKEWGREVFGVGGVAILDSEATRKFNDIVPSGFNVSPWSIRTFEPKLDFESPESASRHRFLGTSRLVEERPGRVARILGVAARSQVSALPIPKEVLDALHLLEMASDQKLLSRLRLDRGSTKAPRMEAESAAATNAIGGGSEIEKLRGQIELVKSWLEISEVTDEQLLEVAEAIEFKNSLGAAASEIEVRITGLQAQVFELEENEQAYEALLAEYDQSIVLKERESFRLSQEKVALQTRLLTFEDGESAFSEVDLPSISDVPENMEDLGDRIADLEQHGVVFTGDVGTMESLSRYDTNGRIVLGAWQCLLVCVDYLRARSDEKFSGGVHDYLSNSPEGYLSISPGKHAAGESESTENQYGRERVFPVPTEVEAAGRVYMGAHFKLSKVGMVTPRIHYYFDGGNTEKIYIGYIGPHLRNQGTN